MFERFVRWLLRLLRRDCFEIGRAGDIYLTRWTLLGRRVEGSRDKLFLHLFHRGDADEELHDHPWPYWSLILWGGYWEVTPPAPDDEFPALARLPVVSWRGPLSLLRRPAEWRHRVIVPAGKRCWTVVWAGPKERTWFFWCPAGPVPWREFLARQDAGRHGCGEP